MLNIFGRDFDKHVERNRIRTNSVTHLKASRKSFVVLYAYCVFVVFFSIIYIDILALLGTLVIILLMTSGQKKRKEKIYFLADFLGIDIYWGICFGLVR